MNFRYVKAELGEQLQVIQVVVIDRSVRRSLQSGEFSRCILYGGIQGYSWPY